MSRDEVEALREGYAAFNAGDPTAFFAQLADDFVYRAREELPGGGQFEGREAFEARMAGLWDLFGEVRFEPEEIVEVGGYVVVRVRQSARGRASGAPFETRITHVWRVDGGAAKGLTVYTDHDEALAAAASGSA